MTPQDAFDWWRADFDLRSHRSGASQWSGLTQALAELVLHNSRGVHGRVVLARLNDLEDIVSDLRQALHGHDHELAGHERDNQRLELHAVPASLRMHLSPENAFQTYVNANHVGRIDRDLLDQIVARYLQRPWLANDVLEWMMVDAAVHDEIVSFGESIERDIGKLIGMGRRRRGGRSINRLGMKLVKYSIIEILALMSAPIAMAVPVGTYASRSGSSWILLVALIWLLVYTSLVVLRVRQQRRQRQVISKATALWSAMLLAYNLLNPPVVVLSRVKDVLKMTAAKGAAWRKSTYALLEFAEARGAEAWRL